MNAPQPIGGFFEFELTGKVKGDVHTDAYALTNGRACLSAIIKLEVVSRIYIPYFSCDTILVPFEAHGIPCSFYAIDQQFDPLDLPELQRGEWILYINYFGLKDATVQKLLKIYGGQLIIDNTHSFFHKGYAGNYSFTSARKYFGVPDGAYLYGADNMLPKDLSRFQNISIEHSIQRLEQNFDEAYQQYRAYEDSLGLALLGMSHTTEQILNRVDLNEVAEQRQRNFDFLNNQLQKHNQFDFDASNSKGPFCYPLLTTKLLDKSLFYKEKIFVPVLWPEVLSRAEAVDFQIEREIAASLLALPIDHRYSEDDMKRVVDLLEELL